MDLSCIDVPDQFFSEIPSQNHKNQLNNLEEMIHNSEYYQKLLNHSTPYKISDRSLVSIVVTVIYELDQQISYESVNGKLTRYVEIFEEEVKEFNYISRNRYLCKIEGLYNKSIPSICYSRGNLMKKNNQNNSFNQLICVIGFEDGVQLKIGERYHLIGIYQSSRFDEDNELDIKLPTNQKFYILLWRTFGLTEYCLDSNGFTPQMNIVLNQYSKSISLDCNNFNVRNHILTLFNSIIPEPMNLHLLLNLVSSIHTRQPMVLQKYSLGLIVDSFDPFINNLKEVLHFFNPFVEVIDACQTKSLLPQITSETIEYEEHSLQIGNDSIVIITANKEINEQNKILIEELLNQQMLQFNIYGQPINIPINCSVIFVTKRDYNEDMIRLCDHNIIIHQGITNISINHLLHEWNQKEILDAYRYFAYCRKLKCSITEDVQDIVTNSFVNARKINSNIDQMSLHKWLNVACILGSSYGKRKISHEIWNETLQLLSLN
ncbi:hypothetical protein EHI8A_180090 [Entamoeba histolytica HM-1:IMSS-B]|uniref:Mini-chromosome maintenance complex-binding protein n=6 Tax=Entamoeba histolytica TaxID=5759 RepID=C4LY88_ENTH1|nr:hypothetical protein EHI_166840 [Entamoeba histolytica HM-1:IMSS]EMD44026.1 Hypothetical protein EHI5A_077610 [Entamoeba histolytica KU27]EMH77450.1 hypothetical protein EHI8A_180090 [Entamoeba histolytica HM-1:IMSS-B]EMS13590.1 hypothetical protein KM1_243800 [Entamoeba histolytica HM-3:IMSS]ENY60070.1 hypothetical protein EHI7A_150970 [Entamoeba histolytica HM-1:IMSS-A]GAT93769.1 hypothetical protein CL6EHI_166840 [Entamoeba histolytica]|eukprot:XP_650516.1 hypothetical protein EHI_166840 [Entamoeba histolytica HM-1:IMSS]